jgi:hypothetical protein
MLEKPPSSSIIEYLFEVHIPPIEAKPTIDDLLLLLADKSESDHKSLLY